MLKLLILGGIIYFIYRFYIAPPSIGKGKQQGKVKQDARNDKAHEQHDDDDGEYIDYEEVD
ncbi:MAG: hypothetical protein MRY78_01705 [Saprospiraceae bacterium]|nr:hypothetical protein [Saprospiraceae bacterium]